MTGGRQLRTQVAVAAIVLVPALAAPVSARTETVRFAVTDMEGLEQLQQAFGAFETELEKVTGLAMELFPASSRTAAVEAMRAEQVYFVMTWPAEYGIMKELLDRRIVVAWQRPDYFSQIVALADGPIKALEDLRGKTVTFGAVGSTSQHLGPAQALADLRLKTRTDYQAQIRSVAVEALIRGDVAAVGMNFVHLVLVRLSPVRDPCRRRLFAPRYSSW